MAAVQTLLDVLLQLESTNLLDSEVTGILTPLVQNVAAETRMLDMMLLRHGYREDGEFCGPIDLVNFKIDLVASLPQQADQVEKQTAASEAKKTESSSGWQRLRSLLAF